MPHAIPSSKDMKPRSEKGGQINISDKLYKTAISQEDKKSSINFAVSFYI